MNDNTKQTIVSLINDCSSINPNGTKTVDYTLYQMRYVIQASHDNESWKFFNRIIEIQGGLKGPVTEAGIQFMQSVLTEFTK